MKEKILIIEDDPLIRNELKTLLQSNGYKTVAPEDFSDVIDQIKAEQPHLIILDIKLPGTSGFSLCTEIRTHIFRSANHLCDKLQHRYGRAE